MKKVCGDYVKNAKMVRMGDKETLVLDISAQGGMGFFSPQSDWGDIEIEGMKEKGRTLKGVWESLKVYKNRKEVDLKYCVDEKWMMKERGCKSYGPMVGWRWNGETLGMEEAVEKIRRIYEEELRRRFGAALKSLKKVSETRRVVLLVDESEVMPFDYGAVVKKLIEE